MKGTEKRVVTSIEEIPGIYLFEPSEFLAPVLDAYIKYGGPLKKCESGRIAAIVIKRALDNGGVWQEVPMQDILDHVDAGHFAMMCREGLLTAIHREEEDGSTFYGCMLTASALATLCEHCPPDPNYVYGEGNESTEEGES